MKIIKAEFVGSNTIQVKIQIGSEIARVDLHLKIDEVKNDMHIFGIGLDHIFLNGKLQSIGEINA